MNINDNLQNQIKEAYSNSANKFEFINSLREFIHTLSPENCNPVDLIRWVPLEKVIANNYNPNSVANKELGLLYTSIREDGYTQPIVTFWDEEKQKYVIVDGFHRNLIQRKHSDIRERCQGRLPIVVLDKDISERMASTVRHNRARGSHSVDGMTNIVFSMMKDGKSEKEICDALGMERQEFVKLKYVSGFAKIFKNYEYSRSIDLVTSMNSLEEKVKV